MRRSISSSTSLSGSRFAPKVSLNTQQWRNLMQQPVLICFFFFLYNRKVLILIRVIQRRFPIKTFFFIRYFWICCKQNDHTELWSSWCFAYKYLYRRGHWKFNRRQPIVCASVCECVKMNGEKLAWWYGVKSKTSGYCISMQFLYSKEMSWHRIVGTCTGERFSRLNMIFAIFIASSC